MIVVSRSVGAVCHVGNRFDFAIISTFFSSMLLLHPLRLPYHYMHCPAYHHLNQHGQQPSSPLAALLFVMMIMHCLLFLPLLLVVFVMMVMLLR